MPSGGLILFSPRMRGLKAIVSLRLNAGLVFPAHAGVEGARRSPHPRSSGFPRACGG